MVDLAIWFLFFIIACIGLVQALSWIAIRLHRKHYCIYRVIPVGGEGCSSVQQLALMYSCLQWESNPSGQVFVLYNAGLDEEGVRDCRTLASGTGVLYANTNAELLQILSRASNKSV